MEKKYYYTGVGIFLLIGLFISIINVNSSRYYQTQYYNSLPSLQQPVQSEIPKPEAIQHYENMRDESVKDTEKANQILALPSATNNQTINYYEILLPTKDGNINADFIILLSFFMMFYISGIRIPILNIHTYKDVFGSFYSSFITTIIFILLINIISPLP